MQVSIQLVKRSQQLQLRRAKHPVCVPHYTQTIKDPAQRSRQPRQTRQPTRRHLKIPPKNSIPAPAPQGASTLSFRMI